MCCKLDNRTFLTSKSDSQYRANLGLRTLGGIELQHSRLGFKLLLIFALACSAALFATTPQPAMGATFAFQDEYELPAVNEENVKQLLVTVIRNAEPSFAIDQIGEIRQTDFDERRQLRYGTCKISVGEQEVELAFLIHWLNRADGRFGLRLEQLLLPSCRSPATKEVLEGLLKNFFFKDAESITIGKMTDTKFDTEEDVRYGTCMVTVDDQEYELRIKNVWTNKKEGNFAVRILNEEFQFKLPASNEEQVIELVPEALQAGEFEKEIAKIGDIRELRYDKSRDIRFCEVDVQFEDETKEVVPFLVEWIDSVTGRYQVRLIPDEIPACTSNEMKLSVRNIVVGSNKFTDLLRIEKFEDKGFDEKKETRYGRCVVVTKEEEIPLDIIITWRDKEIARCNITVNFAQE